jgi:hypothetical protein
MHGDGQRLRQGARDEVDRVRERVHAPCRYDSELGKAAVNRLTDSPAALAQIHLTSAAGDASAANVGIGLRSHPIAHADVCYPFSDLVHGSGKLVSQDDRDRDVAETLSDEHVSSAEGRTADSDSHLPAASMLLGNVEEGQVP